MQIKLAFPLQYDSIVDGEGIRTVIWTQGCTHNCRGCHNPNTHSFENGFLVDINEIKNQLNNLKAQDGITLSGGDPFFQIKPVLELAKYCKKINLNVWCYTGFTFEELLIMGKNNPEVMELLNHIDVLIDGKFILEEKSLNLKFRGSKNQRILNVKKSLENNRPVQIKKYQSKNTYQPLIKEDKYLFV